MASYEARYVETSDDELGAPYSPSKGSPLDHAPSSPLALKYKFWRSPSKDLKSMGPRKKSEKRTGKEQRSKTDITLPVCRTLEENKVEIDTRDTKKRRPTLESDERPNILAIAEVKIEQASSPRVDNQRNLSWTSTASSLPAASSAPSSLLLQGKFESDLTSGNTEGSEVGHKDEHVSYDSDQSTDEEAKDLENTRLNVSPRNNGFLTRYSTKFDQVEVVRNSIGAIELLKGRPRVASTSSSFVAENELQGPPDGEDEDTIRAILAVHEVLSCENKTIQGLLDPKMVLLRALFDVPDWSEFNTVAALVMNIFEWHRRHLSLIQWAIRQEVQFTASANTLFREDTMPSALAAYFLKTVGRTYLQKVLATPIVKIHQSKQSYEIDLNRPGGSKSNVGRLTKFVETILKSVFDSVSMCPGAIRDFLYHMCSEIRDRFPPHVVTKTVCSFYFLHYICPAIVYPASCGIIDKPPAKEAQRALILAAKILQNLANGVQGQSHEPHLFKINKLFSKYSHSMETFIESMSTKQTYITYVISESSPTPSQYRTSLSDLQKYMSQKLATLVNYRPSDTTNEKDQIQRLLKLRRAIQACSKMWGAASTDPINPNPKKQLSKLNMESSSANHSRRSTPVNVKELCMFDKKPLMNSQEY